MNSVGITPNWRPPTAHDRLVAFVCTVLFWGLSGPLAGLSLVLGRLRVDWVVLDILAIPGGLLQRVTRRLGGRPARWGLLVNAYAHIYLLCRMCPASRQALRDPEQRGRCVWNHRWNRGEFDIVPDFGARNWLTQYRGRTDLGDYVHLAVRGKSEGRAAVEERFVTLRRSVSLTTSVIGLALLLWVVMYWSFITSGIGALRGTWEELAEVPEAANKYPPQGLTLVDDHLVFTNHWNDTKSAMYLLDPDTMEVIDETVMPPEAVHTSGLCWDGEHLWAVDYKSNLLYVIDLAASFEGDSVVVVDSYPTGLSGTSAMTLVTIDGEQYFAISDFMRTKRTYLVAKADVPKLNDHHIADVATATYRNKGFSQGLTWDGTFLYEASNSLVRDCVHVYRVDEAIRTGGEARVEYIARIRGPVFMLEDLATDGTRLWTSSEKAFHFYVLTDLPALRERLAD